MLKLAFSLSRGRILEDPRPLICTEILHIPLHPDFVLFGRTIRQYIDSRPARNVNRRNSPSPGSVQGNPNQGKR